MVGEFASQKFSYEKEAMQKILDYLTANNTQAIETTQLQILCHNLEKKNLSTIGIANIPEFEDIFLQFYNDTIAKIAPENQDKARKFVENELVKKGQRVSVSDLTCLDSVDANTLATLVAEHLLRPEYNTSTQRNNYELSHDTLLAPVLRAKELRETAEQKQAEEQRKEAERLAALAKAEAERIENEKTKRQVRILSVAFVIAVLAVIGAIYFGYKTQAAYAELANATTSLEYIKTKAINDRKQDSLKTLAYESGSKLSFQIRKADSLERRIKNYFMPMQNHIAQLNDVKQDLDETNHRFSQFLTFSSRLQPAEQNLLQGLNDRYNEIEKQLELLTK
jgi:hypothetical protein